MCSFVNFQDVLNNTPPRTAGSHLWRCSGGNAPPWRPSPTCCWDLLRRTRTAASQVLHLGRQLSGCEKVNMIKECNNQKNNSCQSTACVPRTEGKEAQFPPTISLSSEAQSAPSERFAPSPDNLWASETLRRRSPVPECCRQTLCSQKNKAGIIHSRLQLELEQK